MADIRNIYGEIVYRLEGNRIYDTYGSWKYEIIEGYLLDIYGSRKYVIKDEYLFDIHGRRKYVIRDGYLFDIYGSRKYDIRDVIALLRLFTETALANGSVQASEIIGYNEDELKKRIPNSAAAFMGCCDALFKAGYKLTKFNADKTKYNGVWVGYAQTLVFDAATDKLLGDIMFYSHPLTFCFIDNYYCMRHLQDWNKAAGSEFCHMIELDEAGVLISTQTRWSESILPPAWLTICARELERGFTINNPKWVDKYDGAEKYVNSAFPYITKKRAETRVS